MFHVTSVVVFWASQVFGGRGLGGAFACDGDSRLQQRTKKSTHYMEVVNGQE